MTSERLHERGAALGALLDGGINVARLIRLDGRVRRGECSDWPDRPAWQPECRCDPWLCVEGVAGPGQWAWRELRLR